MGAGEAIPVPRLVLVRDTSAGDDLRATEIVIDGFFLNLFQYTQVKTTHLIALDAAGSEFVFVATSAVDLLLAWDEALGTDWGLANYAAEALLVPLSRLVFHLLSAFKLIID